MNLGIKVAINDHSISDLERTHAEFAEVWYNANTPDDYTNLFSYLKTHALQSGLHFWGAIANGALATIAYPDTTVANQSLTLIKQTIDTAARNNFSYVNIHPGTRSLVHLDFKTVAFTVLTAPKPIDVCESIFLEHAKELTDYATKRGVVLTIESVPPRTANKWLTTGVRNNVIDLGELPITTLMKAVTNGAWFANDFCHTAANCLSDNTKDIWTMLYDVSKQYATQTKLIHLGFLAPPFNGTDFHDQMNNPLLQTTQAVPNNAQLIDLLKLFPNRNDVYALVEPMSDHVRNFFLAKTLLDQASV